MKITVKIKDVYGKNTVYPVCDKAQAFACIAGTATLTHNTLCYIERLGYEICVQVPTYNQQVLQRMKATS